MVCQAATQTRFRALKHENGISGCATIIVRIIACFQPLQDCQAEYFRQLLKPCDCQAYMDKDSGSWSLYKSLGSSCGIGFPNTEPATLRTDPSFPSSEMQQLKLSQLNGSHAPNSSHLRHQLHRSFTPLLYSASREKFVSGTIHFGQERSPQNCAAPPQKRFIVFDRSGDKTTLVYSSAMENPIQYGMPKPPPSSYHNQIEEKPMKTLNPLNPIMNDQRIKYHLQDDLDHEVHEDTEDLNALLCSDSNSDYLKDDEEMSTGRSPSTMTDMGEETGEEANSFTGPTKRQKLRDGSYDPPFLRCNCSSPKTYACTTLDEFTCRDNLSPEEYGSSPSNKRKERIQETLSLLQSIFPNLEGNTAVAFIDKTIQHLISLKFEAKALGLDSR
ncbi:Transcription factor isoform 1 [Dorcoceras hygrometricum]|uniref:Transcription factor isoform 1 n=1 Tax=Dorcoceras hygrometricum TaxID=472368 RepID=A0A2Z7BL81_9LAMI|nr:Transcription factor isoform 1 [Dorcoceras hygrometricum]